MPHPKGSGPKDTSRESGAVVTQRVVDGLSEAGAFERVWERHYTTALESYQSFVERVAEIVTIGAENGTDGAFGEIQSAMRRGLDPPLARVRVRYLWPEPFDEELKTELRHEITAEYRESPRPRTPSRGPLSGQTRIRGFHRAGPPSCWSWAASTAPTTGLATIYRALLDGSPLPTARRRPRRIQ